MKSLIHLGKRFCFDRRGVAAMEFALISPVLVLLYMGSVETITGVDVNRKLDRASTMMSALLTQEKDTITKAKITDVMNLATATLLPYTRDTPKITVTSIVVGTDGVAKVEWSRRRVNGVESRPFTKGTIVALDSNVAIKNTSVIRVDMTMAYVPLIAWTITKTVSKADGTAAIGLDLTQQAYGRVRIGQSTKCSDC
ncbi:TadE/TadG family type IV pilus assembly protein [Phyllobacterium sp. YR531]|uniref:TadE/TadG family type IV pilus assembly protein n=1 Tax=Phyllobacterium sp. YR531 TaxID=1144343 RepID=UPI00026F8F90|nr:TadE/TadG family type IV pilus assembly protein [Phyllobacterium sp. YR531]EJN05287.1 Flp pilus assembly protein TadG [Phyllobacterium sp. YR531]